MLGASQLKLAAGGGVSSNYDPLDVAQFTEAEFRSAVDAAENWGTYVTVHAYTPRAIQTAIRGGVRCIDHGQLMDEATARIMAEKGIELDVPDGQRIDLAPRPIKIVKTTFLQRLYWFALRGPYRTARWLVTGNVK